MNKAVLRSLAATMILGLAVLAGCDNAPQRDGPPTYAVTGTVTQDGSPVDGATVRFQLVDGAQASTGVTNDQGRYVLATFAAGDGAPAGDYRVTITKEVAKGGAQAVSEDDPNYTGEEGDVEMENVLPEKYAKADTSGLTATVTSGANEFDFTIE